MARKKAKQPARKAARSDRRTRRAPAAAVVREGYAPEAASVPQHRYCSLPEVPPRVFSPNVNPNRASLILRSALKWVNGTVLRYYFFKPSDGQTVFFSDGTKRFVSWGTSNAEMDVVRKAFQIWKQVGIGLEFKEVNSPSEAEIRIGFMRGDGAWSYIGRDVLTIGASERTMNFGWDLTAPGEIDTALHEIGHTLGFPHEHQNPNAGIVWNEEAVYAALARPPNRWPREKTFHNIISKIPPDQVQGSNWDPDSIMHYPFEAGLIRQPEPYHLGLTPAGGLSARDKTWVKTFYPPLTPADEVALQIHRSVQLRLKPGEQKNFTIDPPATRMYDIGTFGASDTVMVLFEDVGGELRYRTGDDDSGEDRNAKLRVKLFKGKRYVLRVRLYYAERSGETSVMMW
jgi:hypothetical protein